MHIYKLLKAVTRKINTILTKFLWAGPISSRKFHLARMELISPPVKLGGWKLKDIDTFNSALLLKNLWREVHHKGLLAVCHH